MFDKDHERLRRPARPGAASADPRAGVPGKSTRVAGLIQRAQASPATALPAALRARFEQSTGADLGGVRVHTGAESAEAAAAVDARAFAIGSDLHFAAGEFAPGSAAGDHLIAHEAFHALQAPAGAAPATDDELAVSHGSDPAELDADRAADAMITGAPAAAPSPASGAVVHRKADDAPPKDNSYNRGTLTWQGGTALQDDEIAKWGAARLKIVNGAMDYFMWTTGWKGIMTDSIIAKLEAEISDRYDREVFVRDAKVAHMKKEIAHLEGLDEQERTPFEHQQLVTHQLQLPLAITEALTFRDEREGAISRVTTDAAKIAGSIAAYGKTGASLATQVLDHATGSEPAHFKSLADALGTAGGVVNALAFAAKAYDRTALEAFESNPSFETAAAWGKKVGDLLGHAGALAGGLPFPWNQVLKGVAAMPRFMIAQFTEVVRTRYAKIDQMTRGDACQKSELLRPGETACAK